MAEYTGQKFGGIRNVFAWIFIPLAALVTRVAIGQGFFIIGHGKTEDIAAVQKDFEALGIQYAEYLAPFVSYAEWIGGALLVLGLGTRLVALVLSVIMGVAIYQAHWDQVLGAFQEFYPDKGVALVSLTAIPFLFGSLWLVGRGPGVFSLDALIMMLLNRNAEDDDWEE